jgi:hypothetical protein
MIRNKHNINYVCSKCIINTNNLADPNKNSVRLLPLHQHSNNYMHKPKKRVTAEMQLYSEEDASMVSYSISTLQSDQIALTNKIKELLQ